MKNNIEQISKVLGSTDAGRAWCLKALHPSEHVPNVKGIPDRSGQATTMLEYTSRFSIADTSSSSTTWGADLSLIPHPVAFLAVTNLDGSGAFSKSSTFYNTQLGAFGDSVLTKTTTFLAASQRFRIAYASMTVELDASALYNGGNVVAAQYPCKRRRAAFMANATNMVFTIPTTDSSTIVCWGRSNYTPSNIVPAFAPFAFSFQAADEPDYATLINMPSAFTGLARDGVYMPLIIDNVEQKWFGESDLSYYAGQDGINFRDYQAPGTAGGIGGHSTGSVTGGTYRSSASAWPFALSGSAETTGYVIPCTSNLSATTTTSAATVNVYEQQSLGDRFLPPVNNNWGHACFKGLSPNATLLVTVRMGFEIEAQPGTAYSMLLAPSPLHDPVALDMYYYIRHRMPDAFPAVYNDFDKLLGVVLSGAKAALPFLAALFPAFASYLPATERLVESAVILKDMINRNKNQAKKKDLKIVKNMGSMIKK